jgi:hypothetical protein
MTVNSTNGAFIVGKRVDLKVQNPDASSVMRVIYAKEVLKIYVRVRFLLWTINATTLDLMDYRTLEPNLVHFPSFDFKVNKFYLLF